MLEQGLFFLTCRDPWPSESKGKLSHYSMRLLDLRSYQRGDVKEWGCGSHVHFDQLLIIIRAFNFGEFMNGKAQQSMPELLVRQETEIYRFELLCRDLCTKLLRLFALGLKVGYLSWFAPASPNKVRSALKMAARTGFRRVMIHAKVHLAVFFACYMYDLIDIHLTPDSTFYRWTLN